MSVYSVCGGRGTLRPKSISQDIRKNKNMSANARYKEQLLHGLSRILPGRVKYSTTDVTAMELNHQDRHLTGRYTNTTKVTAWTDLSCSDFV